MFSTRKNILTGGMSLCVPIYPDIHEQLYRLTSSIQVPSVNSLPRSFSSCWDLPCRHFQLVSFTRFLIRNPRPLHCIMPKNLIQNAENPLWFSSFFVTSLPIPFFSVTLRCFIELTRSLFVNRALGLFAQVCQLFSCALQLVGNIRLVVSVKLTRVLASKRGRVTKSYAKEN